jgi:hypothetical protein
VGFILKKKYSKTGKESSYDTASKTLTLRTKVTEIMERK